MKALTIKQPFAAWIVDGHKTIELRTWATAYRGPLLITASARPAQCLVELDDGSSRLLPAGCLVCLVDLVDCRPATPADSEAAQADITPGEYAWILSNPRPLQPQQVKGKLSLWDYQGEMNHLPAGADWLDWRP